MSNTLKFGNGQWATKKGSTLAYNDENGNFKPLPFNFERATSATRVNKEGLIEVVGNNEPRIDFKDNSKGALLLEPSRTNVLSYSEDFSQSYWTKNNVSIVSNDIISPDGTLNADKMTSIGTTSFNLVETPSLSGDYTLSFYAKKGTSDFVWVYLNGYNVIVDLSNGTYVTSISNAPNSYLISNIGNGWYRISVTQTSPSADTVSGIGVANSSGFNGVVGEYIYIYGAMLEQGSYPTSYIPTNGSSATRVGEYNIQDLSNQVSLTEGVFYIDTTNLGRSQNANILTQNSTVNSVYGYIQTNNRILFGLYANSVSIPITSSLEYTIGTRTKIAFQYKSGNSKLYVNGSLVGNSTDTFTLGSGFADAIRLIDNLSAYSAFPEKSTLNEFKVYNKALTDQELIALTS